LAAASWDGGDRENITDSFLAGGVLFLNHEVYSSGSFVSQLGLAVDFVTDHERTSSRLSVNDTGLMSDHQLVTATGSVRQGFPQLVQIQSRCIRGIDTN
jgi:hypothetical protein